MTQILATIEWYRRQAAFTDNRYSRVHSWTFDGGTTIVASSSPHIVPPPMSDSAAVDPEEAFVASLSSCHMLWFLSIAAKRGFCVNRYLDRAYGEMGKNDSGKTVMTKVTLRPVIDWGEPKPSPWDVTEMHHAAHNECFIANSVRTCVAVEMEGPPEA